MDVATSGNAPELTLGEGVEPTADPTDPNLSEAQKQLQQQQLQLIQLCFYEHEFGVDLDDDGPGEGDGGGAPSNDSLASPLLDYDPLAFIEGKISHGVSLEDLCKDLAFYMDYIKEKINYHVNNDMHTAFVDVSARLGGMESELQYVERPLSASIKKVSASCDELAAVADAVDVKVQHASDVEEERMFDINFLKGLLLYENIASTIEEEIAPLVEATVAASSLASAEPSSSSPYLRYGRASSSSPLRTPSPRRARGGEVDGSGREDREHVSSSSPTDTSTSRAPPVLVSATTLEKLQATAMSARQLDTLAALLPTLPQREKEKAELAMYVAECNAAVLQLLRAVFEHLCGIFFAFPEETGVTQALRDVTLIYASAHARDAFCAMFRESVLAPFLEKIFPWKAATQARQSTEETLRLLARLETELQSNITSLFPLFRRCFAGEPLNPASTMLWPVLCEVLVKKLVTLYEVGIPDAFQRKYRAAYRLLALAESCCATPEELLALRQSPDVTMWNHKWNTDVYTAMRLKELHKALDPALTPYQTGKSVEGLKAKGGSASAPTTGAAMRLEVFGVLQAQILQLFSPDVFLLPCLQKFLREVVLASQSVAKAALAYTMSALASIPANPGAGGESDQSGSTAGGTGPSLLPFLSLLMVDVGQWRAACDTDGAVHAAIFAALSEGGLDAVVEDHSAGGLSEAVTGVLALVREQVCPGLVNQAQRHMTAGIEEECLAALQNVKSVRSAYSHTKKPFPTAPSWYIPSVVDPIVRFAKVSCENGLDSAGLQAMLSVITDAVANQFTALARETLITAKKTEESWEKLRRKKDPSAVASGAGGESGATLEASPPPNAGRPTAETATDRDKMTLQLYLDAKAFEDAVTAAVTYPSGDINKRAPRSKAVEGLFALLRRAEWILGADIPEPPEMEDTH